MNKDYKEFQINETIFVYVWDDRIEINKTHLILNDEEIALMKNELKAIYDLVFSDNEQDTIRCPNCNVEFPFELFVKRKDVFDFCFCCGDFIKK